MKYLNTKLTIGQCVKDFIKSKDSVILVLTQDCEIIIRDLAQEIFMEYYGVNHNPIIGLGFDPNPKSRYKIIMVDNPNDIHTLISLYKNCGRKIFAITACLIENQIADIEKQCEAQIPLFYQQNNLECWLSWAEAKEIHPLIRRFIKENGVSMVSGLTNNNLYTTRSWQSMSTTLYNWDKYGIDDVDLDFKVNNLPQEFKECCLSHYKK